VSTPFDAGANTMTEMWRAWTEGPRLADAGAAEQRMARLTDRWIEFQTASRAYEGVVGAAWITANRAFAGRLQERFTAGEATQPDDALKLWLDTANETLLETQRSPSFLESQRRLLRCGMDFLLAQREVVEKVVEPAGLPTRTEIDEVHRSIHELKRRLRRLERETGR
jgi:polyhydroxyalkanoate synthase subunit PhaE